MKTVREEFLWKIEKVRNLVIEKEVGGIEVKTQANFAWLTCGGRGFINVASEGACASIVVSLDQVYLLTNRIEASRLLAEELSEIADAMQIHVFPWEELDGENPSYIRKILNGKPYLTDEKLAPEFVRMRSCLTALEIERYTALGLESARCLENVCRNLRPGVSEFETAGLLCKEVWDCGIEPIVSLVAFDERIELFRHPLPTAKRLAKTAMVVLCARRYGLIASCTRLVSIGEVSPELARKHQSVAKIDARYICGTKPGVKIGEVLLDAMEAYREEGYADEWKLHHQGGLAGYNTREIFGTAQCEEIVLANQVFAWNPSITGTKSEDSILVTESGNKVLTHTGEYAYVSVQCGADTLLRPDILKL